MFLIFFLSFLSFLIVKKKTDCGGEGRVEDLGEFGEQGKYDKVYCIKLSTNNNKIAVLLVENVLEVTMKSRVTSSLS